ncbi:MAG TPA: DNA-binding transcriptional regulator Fis [Sedimenticola sp.]|nr:DNA-binding transcriptional regulator Fis [Sedimenticola sp.]
MNPEPIRVTENTKEGVISESAMAEPLRECVRAAMKNYFLHLNGYGTSDLYQMVLAEVEPPLLETVMEYTRGNQTRAAEVLGISRSTLRKKLALYGLDK